jgi:hypothetical protein
VSLKHQNSLLISDKSWHRTRNIHLQEVKKGFLHLSILYLLVHGGFMNSISMKKKLISLSLSLITVMVLTTGCASSAGSDRSVAQEQKNDVVKISDGTQGPHKFHSKRFEQNNSRY